MHQINFSVFIWKQSSSFDWPSQLGSMILKLPNLTLNSSGNPRLFSLKSLFEITEYCWSPRVKQYISLYAHEQIPSLIQACCGTPQSSSLLLFCPEYSYRFWWVGHHHMVLISVLWSSYKLLRIWKLFLRDTLDRLRQMPVKSVSHSLPFTSDQLAQSS